MSETQFKQKWFSRIFLFFKKAIRQIFLSTSRFPIKTFNQFKIYLIKLRFLQDFQSWNTVEISFECTVELVGKGQRASVCESLLCKRVRGCEVNFLGKIIFWENSHFFHWRQNGHLCKNFLKSGIFCHWAFYRGLCQLS